VKVVLDTNVLIAAFASRGLCEDVFRIVLADHELIVSEFILAEFERVLVDKLKMPAARARAVADFVRDSAQVVNPSERPAWPQRDVDDRWVVATAIAGKAECLVSGDRDLLDDAHEAPFEVVSPRGFWERLK
jgi:uncharacterized protein